MLWKSLEKIARMMYNDMRKKIGGKYMKIISPFELPDNFFKALSDEWMLVTAVNESGKVNTMTASWGGFGYMWARPVGVCVIRPQRYTNEFAKEADVITLSFLEDGNRDALKLCGTVSGRDRDKITESGLKIIEEDGYAYFEQSRLTLVGRKIYVDRFKEECFIDKTIIDEKYPKRDYHDVYVLEIEKVIVKD